jgi:hypothetical protein
MKTAGWGIDSGIEASLCAGTIPGSGRNAQPGASQPTASQLQLRSVKCASKFRAPRPVILPGVGSTIHRASELLATSVDLELDLRGPPWSFHPNTAVTRTSPPPSSHARYLIWPISSASDLTEHTSTIRSSEKPYWSLRPLLSVQSHLFSSNQQSVRLREWMRKQTLSMLSAL